MLTEIAQPTNPIENRAAYTSPAITHELQLETRAGSPLSVDPLIDPLGLGVPER